MEKARCNFTKLNKTFPLWLYRGLKTIHGIDIFKYFFSKFKFSNNKKKTLVTHNVGPQIDKSQIKFLIFQSFFHDNRTSRT